MPATWTVHGLLASAAGVLLAPGFAVAAEAPGGAAEEVAPVVVMAQRREQRLQDVPLAVSAVSGEQLQATGFQNPTDIQFIVPSVQFDILNGGAFKVRGVGTQTFEYAVEQSVGVVIDDVVQGVPRALGIDALTDIERIEVLKGPQGTLFGKNASAGVIQIFTRKPQLDVTSLDARVSYGSGDETRFLVNLNAPLGGEAAARLSIYDQRRGGYVRNGFSGRDIGAYNNYGARAKVLWRPTDDLSVYAIADYQHARDNGASILTTRANGIGFSFFPGAPPFMTQAQLAPYGVVAGPANRRGAWDGPIEYKSNSTGGSLHVDYTLGQATLTSVTAYRAFRSAEDVDVDATPSRFYSVNHTGIRTKAFTQEVRLAGSAGSKVEYTLGAFYYDVRTKAAELQAGTYGLLPETSPVLIANLAGGPAGRNIYDLKTRSFAAFGQATARLTSRFGVTGGLRYTHDKVDSDFHVAAVPGTCEIAIAFGGPCNPSPTPSPVVPVGTSKGALSGKVGAEYHVSDDIMVYASYARGYKGPTVARQGGDQLVVRDETSDDVQAGIKSQFLDRRLTVNTDVFFTRYHDFQAQTLRLDRLDPSRSKFTYANAPRVDTKGIEVEITARPARGLTLSGSLAYVPTKIRDFIVQCPIQAGPAGPALPAGKSCLPGGVGYQAAGSPLPFAPKLTYNLSASYERDLGGDLTFDASANYVWKGRYYTIVPDINTVQKGFGLLGATAGVGPRNGAWRVSVFGRNLLDQNFVSGVIPAFFDTNGYFNIPTSEASRTVGVAFEMRIGGS